MLLEKRWKAAGHYGGDMKLVLQHSRKLEYWKTRSPGVDAELEEKNALRQRFALPPKR